MYHTLPIGMRIHQGPGEAAGQRPGTGRMFQVRGEHLCGSVHPSSFATTVLSWALQMQRPLLPMSTECLEVEFWYQPRLPCPTLMQIINEKLIVPSCWRQPLKRNHDKLKTISHFIQVFFSSAKATNKAGKKKKVKIAHFSPAFLEGLWWQPHTVDYIYFIFPLITWTIHSFPKDYTFQKYFIYV